MEFVTNTVWYVLWEIDEKAWGNVTGIVTIKKERRKTIKYADDQPVLWLNVKGAIIYSGEYCKSGEEVCNEGKGRKNSKWFKLAEIKISKKIYTASELILVFGNYGNMEWKPYRESEKWDMYA